MRKALFPATFDPVHNGHIDIIKRAAAIFDEVVVGVYDHGKPLKNVLFSIEDRIRMTRDALHGYTGVTVQPYSGLTVDFARSVGAQAIVRGLRVFSDFELEFRMALANRRLDPALEVVCFIASEEHMYLASSTIREIASLGGDVSSMVPEEVHRALLAKFGKLGDHGVNDVEIISLRD
jgi:pantetheine-phosphate adenylyltransferase